VGFATRSRNNPFQRRQHEGWGGENGHTPSYDDAATEQIQRDHLACYKAMREAGHVATNGPVLDQPDEALRRISIWATEPVDRAREQLNTDPAVQAGRLEVAAMTWLCPPGTMISGGIPVTVDLWRDTGHRRSLAGYRSPSRTEPGRRPLPDIMRAMCRLQAYCLMEITGVTGHGF
jgi:uncharacterized protein YciI